MRARPTVGRGESVSAPGQFKKGVCVHFLNRPLGTPELPGGAAQAQGGAARAQTSEIPGDLVHPSVLSSSDYSSSSDTALSQNLPSLPLRLAPLELQCSESSTTALEQRWPIGTKMDSYSFSSSSLQRSLNFCSSGVRHLDEEIECTLSTVLLLECW